MNIYLQWSLVLQVQWGRGHIYWLLWHREDPCPGSSRTVCLTATVHCKNRTTYFSSGLGVPGAGELWLQQKLKKQFTATNLCEYSKPVSVKRVLTASKAIINSLPVWWVAWMNILQQIHNNMIIKGGKEFPSRDRIISCHHSFVFSPHLESFGVCIPALPSFLFSSTCFSPSFLIRGENVPTEGLCLSVPLFRLVSSHLPRQLCQVPSKVSCSLLTRCRK